MVTAEQVAIAAAKGPYWWVRPDQTVYATTKRTAGGDGDVYLLRASKPWLAQWDGDWQKAADQINEAITRQEQEAQ